eukprot:CAMPEP_0171596816 /NCGR_PEP_ID=MMETSP0990-20121206/2168_1 /TAXON_ID=483369 /ORGANISM="non described non described, Strain CCMP2098" /LENGTH=94 /DNA_ID=CAMNT_0012158085 /DNA_START=456 /DNA_END=739 /DNA_ORIENTATION=+
MAKLWLRATPEYTQSGASIHASTSNAAKLPEVEAEADRPHQLAQQKRFPLHGGRAVLHRLEPPPQQWRVQAEKELAELKEACADNVGVSVGGFC